MCCPSRYCCTCPSPLADLQARLLATSHVLPLLLSLLYMGLLGQALLADGLAGSMAGIFRNVTVSRKGGVLWVCGHRRAPVPVPVAPASQLVAAWGLWLLTGTSTGTSGTGQSISGSFGSVAVDGHQYRYQWRRPVNQWQLWVCGY